MSSSIDILHDLEREQRSIEKYKRRRDFHRTTKLYELMELEVTSRFHVIDNRNLLSIPISITKCLCKTLGRRNWNGFNPQHGSFVACHMTPIFTPRCNYVALIESSHLQSFFSGLFVFIPRP